MYKRCSECKRFYPVLEIHHIVFRSHGGLDFLLNYKRLCHICHKGNQGPHRDHEKDLEYKRTMERALCKKLRKAYYADINEVKDLLQLKGTQIYAVIKTIVPSDEGYSKYDIIRQLMGGKSYL